jgi:hypothetical protein
MEKPNTVNAERKNGGRDWPPFLLLLAQTPPATQIRNDVRLIWRKAFRFVPESLFLPGEPCDPADLSLEIALMLHGDIGARSYGCDYTSRIPETGKRKYHQPSLRFALSNNKVSSGNRLA